MLREIKIVIIKDKDQNKRYNFIFKNWNIYSS